MVAVAQACSLCGQSTHVPVTGAGAEIYCCPACLEVAALLAEPAPQPAEDADQDLTLGIRGLWCSSCAWLVEERLRRTPGIAAVRVSYLERRARIAFDSAQIKPEAIRRKIRALGYRTGPDAESEEGEAFFTRLLIGGLLAMHIMVTSLIMYARDWLGFSGPDSAWLEHIFYLMQFVVSLPLAVILGFPIIRAGINGLLRGLPNVQTLVSIGALAALGLSIRNLFAGTGHLYFDTAAMLLFLLTIGRWLEMRAHAAGRTSYEALLDGLPETVRRVTPDGETRLPLTAVRPGMRLRVLPGDQIPVDGRIAAGSSQVDERMLTGEAMPVVRAVGEDVFAGTVNTDGVLDLIVQRTGRDTRAGAIGKLLEDWVWQRSPAEQQADRLAARLVYAALGIAGLTFAGYFVAAGAETALLHSLSVLLIACPCALGIATPLTLRQAYNRAAEEGFLLRRAGLLEQLPDLRRIYFDKTGTLTETQHHVLRWASFGDLSRKSVFYAAALERGANHPVAGAILAYAAAFGGDIPEASDLHMVPGKGLAGVVEGVRVRVGSRAYMEESGLEMIDPALAVCRDSDGADGILVYTGWEGCVRGVALIAEQERPGLAKLFDDLRGLGLSPAVLTGDSAAAGERWRVRLGIPVFAGLSPEEKLSILSSSDEEAVMVGDGINDGPALAAAAVGIALREGSGLARSAAEITLVRDDLSAIPWLIRLGHETRRRLRQNLAWAIGYNLVGVGLAVSGLLQPVLAALAMVLSSALVSRNALQLRKFEGWEREVRPMVPSESRIDPFFDAKVQSRKAPL